VCAGDVGTRVRLTPDLQWLGRGGSEPFQGDRQLLNDQDRW
jgi:hypothetical protein